VNHPLPTYIDRGGELCYQPPFLCQGVMFYAFALEVSREAVQTMLDKYLNFPPEFKGRFQPATDFALLAFTDLKHVSPTDAPYASRGWFPEQECAVWILIKDTVTRKMMFFHPYMVVDNVFAMAIGREVYGFPKTIGTFVLPSGPNHVDFCQMSTFGLRHYDPSTEGGLLKMVEVRRTSPGGTATEWSGLAHGAEEVFATLHLHGSIWEDLIIDWNTLEAFLHHDCSMVFLKQFRDVQQLDGACVQEVNEVTAKVTSFNGGGLLSGDYEVEFFDADSFPIRSDLGITDNVVKPVLSFWVNFDFLVGSGTPIWAEGIGRG